jgi:hypothetical protein
MEGKPFYTSKMIWLNLIALVASLIQARYGLVMSPEEQGVILTVLNLILRSVTKEEIVW